MFSRLTEALRHALAFRLGVWYAGVFAVSAAILLVSTYVLLGRALAEQDHDVLETMLSRYAAEYERSGLEGLHLLVEQDESEGRHERLLVRVVSAQAELVFFAQPPGWSGFDLSRLDRPARTDGGWLSLTDRRDGTTLEVGSIGLPDGVTVQVGRTSHVRDQLLGHFRARALEVGALLALTTVLGGVILALVGLKPLTAMEATAATIIRTRRFDARMPTHGTSDPLDRLAGRINDLLGRIERLVAGMRGALDNVAHDLRTPLTRFRNVAERALTAEDPDQLRDGLARAVEEADRVQAMLTALMDISEAESGTMTLHVERARLAELVDEALALHVDDAEERGIRLTASVDPDVTLEVDRARLRQVLANLVENAVKYTDRDGAVTVGAAVNDGTVTVAVTDTGIGIGADDLPHIWDRLYRADASRSTRGLGLGLCLVKAIVEAHGGHVRVASTPGVGSVFTLSLPGPARGHRAAAS